VLSLKNPKVKNLKVFIYDKFFNNLSRNKRADKNANLPAKIYGKPHPADNTEFQQRNSFTHLVNAVMQTSFTCPGCNPALQSSCHS
jgi:hypothetical protein